MEAASISINWLAVIAAALSSFMIGGLWYGPLFLKAWMDGFGFTEEDLAGRHMPKVFGGALVLAFIAAVNLEMFIGADSTLGFGLFAGFAAGAGWVATFLGILYLFENRSLKAWLVNAGYCTVSLTVMGAILGAW